MSLIDTRLLDVMNDVAFKKFEEITGKPFASGGKLTEADTALFKKCLGDVICEVSSQDGEPQNITKQEGLVFTRQILKSREGYVEPDKQTLEALPSLNGMGKYFQNVDEKFESQGFEPGELKQMQVKEIKTSIQSFQRMKDETPLGHDLECFPKEQEKEDAT